MKITQIVETTTSGSVATVATPLFKQSRKGGNLLTGKKTNKKYANSISEGKMKELSMDLKSGKDGLSDVEFKKKYNKTKEEMRKALQQKPQDTKKVDEAKLDEEDLIMVPGIGRKLKSGFISHKEDRTDHEVEMARSDLFQAAKNAKKVYELISGISEEQGIEGWVQEKIIKANDYLNTIREYLEHKVQTQEGMRGAMLGGAAGAALTRTPMGAIKGATVGSDIQNMFSETTTGAGVIAGGPQYEAHGVEPGPSIKANEILDKIFDAAKSNKSIEINIGGVAGPVTSSAAKAIVEIYRATDRKDDFLQIFMDPRKFVKMLKNTQFNKIVAAHKTKEEQTPIDYKGERVAKIYSTIDKETSSNQATKPKIDIIAEKAVSKAQQKFMGMVHAAQKGEKPASKEVAKVAKDMPKKAAKDFAQTKHKGLPEKKKD
jgi:hypothetical protein